MGETRNAYTVYSEILKVRDYLDDHLDGKAWIEFIQLRTRTNSGILLRRK
jgi:hypothetical protein